MYAKLLTRKRYFVGYLDSHICSSCGDILMNARQTSCGCRYCEKCLPSKCLNCDTEIIESHKDCALDKEILGLSVLCLNHGCSKIKKFENIEKHLKTCIYACVNCQEKELEVSKAIAATHNTVKDSFDVIFKKYLNLIKTVNDDLKSELAELKVEHQKLSTDLPHEPVKPQLDHKTFFDGGTLSWKIYNLYENMRLSRIFTSKAKYMSKRGYKMALKIYLRGDQRAERQFISVFFIICKGDYDEELSWPFTRKMKLAVQSVSSTHKNIVRFMKPDDNIGAYGKPVSQYNLASGIPRFIKISDLLAYEAYVCDDTLTITFDLL
jgi:hypothetical protein